MQLHCSGLYISFLSLCVFKLPDMAFQKNGDTQQQSSAVNTVVIGVSILQRDGISKDQSKLL